MNVAKSKVKRNKITFITARLTLKYLHQLKTRCLKVGMLTNVQHIYLFKKPIFKILLICPIKISSFLNCLYITDFCWKTNHSLVGPLFGTIMTFDKTIMMARTMSRTERCATALNVAFS